MAAWEQAPLASDTAKQPAWMAAPVEGAPKPVDASSTHEMAMHAGEQTSLADKARNVYGSFMEPAAALVTGAIAKPVSDLAGLGQIANNVLTGSTTDPGEIKKATQDALTYQPKTQAGQQAMDVAGKVIKNTLGRFSGAVGNSAATDVGLLGGGPGAQDVARSGGEEFANQLPALVGSRVPEASTARAAQTTTAADTAQSLNSARDAILTKSRAKGYVIPPTAVNDSGVATALESVSGKAATRQVANVKNAEVTNNLIKGDLGIAADQPLTKDAIQAVRKEAGAKTYGEISKEGTLKVDDQFHADLQSIAQSGADVEGAFPGIGAQANAKVQDLVNSLSGAAPNGQQAIGVFKFLNDRAKANFKAAGMGDSQALELAKAQDGAADAVGALIERNLEASGKGDLAQAWKDARVTIAKSYQAENALKGNNIDAGMLATQLRKNKPLSGGFKDVADFADQFPDVAKLPQSGAGVSKLAAMVAGGAGVSLMYGHAGAAAAEAAMSAAPWATRKFLLSDVGQRALATPKYKGASAPIKLKDLGKDSVPGNVPLWALTQQQTQ